MNTKINLENYDIYTGSLILVNKAYKFREEHFFRGNPEKLLTPVYNSAQQVLLQRTAMTLLSELMQEIHGWKKIVPVSGWRSMKEQQDIWDDTLRENGQEFTSKYVAVPGHSEHQTGLAIDLGLKQEHIDFIRPYFPDSGICQKFREKAAKYGFILRYPAGKEPVTGIAHEPWHFRYVGSPHAAIMAEQDLTLEEYTEFVKEFPFETHPYIKREGSQETRVSYLKFDTPITITLSGAYPCTVSGNNVDGFILTEYISTGRN